MANEKNMIYVELCRVSRNLESSQSLSKSGIQILGSQSFTPGILQHWGLLVKEVNKETGECLTMSVYDAGADVEDNLAASHRTISEDELSGWKVSAPVYKGHIVGAGLGAYEWSVNIQHAKYDLLQNNCQLYVKYMVRTLTKQAIPMRTARIFSAHNFIKKD